MKKRMFSLFVVLVIALSISTTIIAQEDSTYSNDPCMYQVEWQEEHYCYLENDPLDIDCETAKMLERDRLLLQCPEHQALLAQREAEFQEWLIQDELERSTNRSSSSSMTLPIPVFQQERGYWCGPATARQVIHWSNGTAPTQAVLAGRDEIGTHSGGSDVHVVGRVVRSHTGIAYVATNLNRDRDTWVHQIRNSIHRHRPALITIRTIGIAAFPYDTFGHIVNVSGYDISTANFGGGSVLTGFIRITDPHHGAGLGNRWYSIDALHNAHITNRIGGGIGQGDHFVGRASW